MFLAWGSMLIGVTRVVHPHAFARFRGGDGARPRNGRKSVFVYSSYSTDQSSLSSETGRTRRDARCP